MNADHRCTVRVYPNSVFQHTTVGFSLEQAETIALNICDKNGRELTTLVQGLFMPGDYSFDVTTRLLRQMSSRQAQSQQQTHDGTYIVRMTVGAASQAIPFIVG